MTGLRFEIDPQVIDKYPEVRVSGFVVDDLTTAASQLEDIAPEIESACESLRQQGINIQNLVNDPRIAGWRKAFDAMGLKPSTYKGSAEQLGRRFCRNEAVRSQLPIVNLYCALSAKYLAPMGGYDLERLPEPSVLLRFARPGLDSFDPLSGNPQDMPLLPEVAVYASDDTVICWGFNYRDSKTTCLNKETRRAAFFTEAVTLEQRGSTQDALERLRAVLRDHGSSTGPIQHFEGQSSQGLLVFVNSDAIDSL